MYGGFARAGAAVAVSSEADRSGRTGGRYLGEYASEQISRGGELELYEIEEETYRSLTLENFKIGLLKYFSEDYMPVARRHDGTWGVDPGMIDEIAADEIIQYALFEEIVYS